MTFKTIKELEAEIKDFNTIYEGEKHLAKIQQLKDVLGLIDERIKTYKVVLANPTTPKQAIIQIDIVIKELEELKARISG